MANINTDYVPPTGSFILRDPGVNFKTARPEVPRRDGLRIRFSPIQGVSTGAKKLQESYVFQNGPLDEISIDLANESEKYKTLRSGEYSRKTGRSLIVAQFTTLVTIVPYSWVMDPNVGFDIDQLTADLVEICQEGYPFELLATYNYNADPYLHLNGARLETLRVTDKAGETDARYFDVGISEWRNPVAAVSAKEGRPGTQLWPKTVRLHKDGHWTWPWKASAKEMDPRYTGLTLALIAKHAYGKASHWRHVAEANGITKWGANDPLIKYSKYRKRGGTITVPDPNESAQPPERRSPVIGDTQVV